MIINAFLRRTCSLASRITASGKCFASLKTTEHSLSAAVREKIGPMRTTTALIGEQQLHLSQTTDCLSFTEQPCPSGEFLMLRITCNHCKNRSTRAFLRSAYEEGVVMVRCTQCLHFHLVADHFGWFEAEITPDTQVRPYDAVAIVKFIKKAF
jgi:hypothetical protein